jgi:hypothetical protein
VHCAVRLVNGVEGELSGWRRFCLCFVSVTSFCLGVSFSSVSVLCRYISKAAAGEDPESGLDSSAEEDSSDDDEEGDDGSGDDVELVLELQDEDEPEQEEAGQEAQSDGPPGS